METKVAYFISDAHLGVNPPGSIEDREETLVHFLKGMIGGASHLFIVGDLFEFWYEYRHYVARGHMPLYRVLGDLVDSGTEVHYLTGNHDFALGDFFSKELGVQVHRTYVAKNIQGHDIYLMHGDGVAKADKGYRAARKLIDAKWAQFLFRQIHPDWGMDIATFVGRNSRKAGKDRVIDIFSYLDAAAERMRDNHCDICVHGHHHIPGIWENAEGKVVSPGQWLFHLNYAKLENGEISVVPFQK
ncbi:UDP-2,3-diacylglucosamine diphosphatase [Hallerella succinigenes]|uniref:UDP-2,3-diacylglucosamine hydrolase n=1 Tax=Hallerella succinigenes TaxID=1896222 RepID=A0A2M9A5J9_9BACT|nr:UDP-2,3-diacylglucosamine diphosphatase [Hallerella succinigenes]MBS7391356.1 UDP-2,3-diacylglucosamine diphosphatase [Fibrobacter sp.]PJJ40907.1 UDP-2,3-diacylglucosamine hydrolase [Hallerella succinigenes]